MDDATVPPVQPRDSFAVRLKDARDNHPIAILGSVFVSGFAMALGIAVFVIPDFQARVQAVFARFWTTPAATSSPTERPGFASLGRPLRISVMGPLSAPNAGFGLRHLRGVLGGLLHALDAGSTIAVDDWQRHFEIDAVDTALPGMNADDRRTRLRQLFDKAQNSSDVVFGPVFSQDAVDVLLDRAVELKAPTILTIAATPRVRTHPQYGKLLFQLSNNIEGYARQYMEYVGSFMAPKPGLVLVLFRSDEYGRSSHQALVKYGLQHNLRMDGLEYPDFDRRVPLRDYIADVERRIQARLKEIRAATPDALVLIADLGETLDAIVPVIRRNAPGVQLGTLTSLAREQLAAGGFDEMYLIYSYAPTLFSNSTLGFLKFQRYAQVSIGRLLPAPVVWEEVDTADAEVHDATIYYLLTFVFPRYREFNADVLNRLYATDFVIRGQGRELGNAGNLFLFQVRAKTIVPVTTPQ